MDGCQCTIDDSWDGDRCEFFTETTRKARKPHKCYECGRTIQPGETYEYVSGKWGGDIETIKTCKECREIRSAFFCAGIYGSVMESFRSYLCDVRGEVPSECILVLSEKARDRVFDEIESVWGELDEHGSTVQES